MYVKKIKRANQKISVQIVKTEREKKNKVVQHIIENIGTYGSDDEIEKAVNKAKARIIEIRRKEVEQTQCLLPFVKEDSDGLNKLRKSAKPFLDFKNLVIERSIAEGIPSIFGHVYDLLGLDKIINVGRKQQESNTLLKQCVMMRIQSPVSKRKSTELLTAKYTFNVSIQRIYRLMDKLSEFEESIKKRIFEKTLALFDNKVEVAFFDVTTLYFESFTADELRNFGFSKDCKFKEVQILLALITTIGGMPLGYEVFEGNKSEGKTLSSCINKIKKQHNISNILLVADRAMFNEENLSLLEKEKVNYIVAAKLKSMSSEMKNKITNFKELTLKHYADVEIDTISCEFEHDKRRLVVDYSSLRAKKDKKDRERLVERLKKYEKNGKINLKNLIKNTGSKKYLKTDPGNKNEGAIDYDKIASSERWDGLHGVISNNKKMTKEAILDRYKGLWQIEAAFRLNKNDLKMRPVFHWKPDRIRAHILFCYVVYTVVTNTKFRLQKFDVNLSFAKIKEALEDVYSVVFKDRLTGKRYLIPRELTETQQKLYHALEIGYSTQAIEIKDSCL